MASAKGSEMSTCSPPSEMYQPRRLEEAKIARTPPPRRKKKKKKKKGKNALVMRIGTWTWGLLVGGLVFFRSVFRAVPQAMSHAPGPGTSGCWCSASAGLRSFSQTARKPKPQPQNPRFIGEWFQERTGSLCLVSLILFCLPPARMCCIPGLCSSALVWFTSKPWYMY